MLFLSLLSSFYSILAVMVGLPTTTSLIQKVPPDVHTFVTKVSLSLPKLTISVNCQRYPVRNSVVLFHGITLDDFQQNFPALKRTFSLFKLHRPIMRLHLYAVGMWFQGLMTCCSMKIGTNVLAPDQANTFTLSKPQHRLNIFTPKVPNSMH